jgi:hypothetical protein
LWGAAGFLTEHVRDFGGAFGACAVQLHVKEGRLCGTFCPFWGGGMCMSYDTFTAFKRAPV